MTTEDQTASPPDPLARAQAAYLAGNFAAVRTEVAVARAAADPEVAGKARELASRVAIDPCIWAVLGAAFALFCGIVVAYAR